jgi:tetratricopeptide (TPR) repeat protein
MGSPKLCDDQTLQDLVSAIESGAMDEIEKADQLLSEYPEDGRLHFLRGSLLAGIGRSIEALSSLRKAVELAPDMAIARFQLGFFLLTSGDPADALSVWGPLALLPEGHYLRFFVGGLTHLIRDEFGDAVRVLEEGIAVNEENPALNSDMRLIVDQVFRLREGGQGDGDDEVSATTMLLGQFAPNRTRH